MFSSFLDTYEGDRLIGEVTSNVEEIIGTGLETVGMSNGDFFPLKIEETEEAKRIVIESPVEYERGSMNLDLEEGEVSISIPGSSEDQNFELENMIHKIKHAADFPSDVDTSSLNIRMEDGNLVMEGPWENSDDENQEDY